MASGQLFLTAFSGYVILRKSLVVHTGKPGDTDCMKIVGYIFIIVDRSIFALSTTFYYLISTKTKKKKKWAIVNELVFRNNRELGPIQAQGLTLEESDIPPTTHSLGSMYFSFLKHKLEAVLTS